MTVRTPIFSLTKMCFTKTWGPFGPIKCAINRNTSNASFSDAWIASRTGKAESSWTNSPSAWRRQVDDTISISIIDICTVLQLSQAQWLMAGWYNWRCTLHRIPNCSCLRLQGKASQGKAMNIVTSTCHPFVIVSTRYTGRPACLEPTLHQAPVLHHLLFLL